MKTFAQRMMVIVWGRKNTFIYSFLRCANISFAMFVADTALIFPSLCFWQYCLCISSAVFLVVLPISFVHHIHRRAGLIFRTLYPWLYEVLAKQKTFRRQRVISFLDLINLIATTKTSKYS